jgi:hypothetical protein
MFTIRFIKHGGRGHKSYACIEYETTHGTDEVEVKMVLKDNTEYFEQIGPNTPYDVAYVTNEAGRTIDKIVV